MLPKDAEGENAHVEAAQPPDLRLLKRRLREELAGVEGISGYGVGEGSLRVYLEHEDAGAKVPPTFQGVPVELVFTGKIRAL